MVSHAYTCNLYTETRSELTYDSKLVILMGKSIFYIVGEDDDDGLRQACFFFLVGLPARGKSYIVKKLRRYLNWLQYETKVYYFCLSLPFFYVMVYYNDSHHAVL